MLTVQHVQPIVQSQARASNLAVFCHVLAFAGYVIPIGNIVGPLVMWLVKRQEDPAVDAHGKESVNFQISMTIYSIAIFVVMMVLAFGLDFFGFFLGMLVMLGILVFDIICIVRGALAASRGQTFRYPLSIRFIR